MAGRRPQTVFLIHEKRDPSVCFRNPTEIPICNNKKYIKNIAKIHQNS